MFGFFKKKRVMRTPPRLVVRQTPYSAPQPAANQNDAVQSPYHPVHQTAGYTTGSDCGGGYDGGSSGDSGGGGGGCD